MVVVAEPIVTAVPDGGKRLPKLRRSSAALAAVALRALRPDEH